MFEVTQTSYMSKKMLYNIVFNGTNFEKGKVYSDEEVTGMDLNYFEEAEESEVEKIITTDVTPPELDSETI